MKVQGLSSPLTRRTIVVRQVYQFVYLVTEPTTIKLVNKHNPLVRILLRIVYCSAMLRADAINGTHEMRGQSLARTVED